MNYKFNSIDLDTDNYRLLVDRKEVSVEPQVFKLIVFLIENKDKVVARDDILDSVWQGRIVSDTSINNHIKSARKVLGDDGKKQQVIKTIHSRGYQFIATLESDLESDLEEQNSFATPLKPKHSFRLFYKAMFVLLSIGIIWWLYHQQNLSVIYSNDKIVVSRSIAILPLTNLDESKEADFLGFALTDQIIGKLYYNRNIQVKPSTLIRKFDQRVVDPIAIGKQLKVQYILNGNYLMQDNLIRVSFELVNVEDNELIWRESQELSYEDLFKLQDNVANILSQKLDKGLSSTEYDNNKNRQPIDAKAYDYYLRSIALSYAKDGNKQALELLRKALDIEPNSAPIHTQLALRLRYGFPNEANEEGIHIVVKHLTRALEINPKYFAALRNLSRIYYDTGEFLKSYDLVKRMLIINPKHSTAYFTLGKIFRKSGMVEESIKMYKKSLSLEFRQDTSNQIGASLFSNSQYLEARRYFDPESDHAPSLAWQGSIALRLGENKKAFDLFQKIAILYPDNYWERDAEIFMDIIKGNTKNGLQKLTMQEQLSKGVSEPTYFIASQYAAFGDKDNALRMYEKAVKGGYYNLSMMRSDAFFDFVRSDEKYIETFNLAQQKHLTFKLAVIDDL